MFELATQEEIDKLVGSTTGGGSGKTEDKKGKNKDKLSKHQILANHFQLSISKKKIIYYQ